MAATKPAAASLPPVTPQEILAFEAPRRPRVGIAALLAAILTVVANLLQQSAYSDLPHVYLLESLRDAAGESIGRAGLRTDQVLHIHDQASSLLVVAIGQALVLGLLGVVLLFLFGAATARGGVLPRPTRVLILVGATAGAIGTIGTQIAQTIAVSDFVSAADHGTHAAHEALRGGGGAAPAIASLLGLVGTLSLTAAFVLVALGAMRVGLLTRFLGVLGAIVGVLILFGPYIGAQSFIVEAFWLAMVGVLVLGRWPKGMPPAWTSGEGRPWPTQQEIREAKQRARGGDGEPVPATPGDATLAVPSPATSARKKRKRRS
jgi:hypothetical protein